MDTLTFGNTSSESGHGLVLDFPEPITPASYVSACGTGSGCQTPTDPSQTSPSQLVTGGLGQTARVLMPRGPNPDVYGGEAIFTMAVDPVKQNYFTAKMWGSDTSTNEWLILDCNSLEVGARHGGDPDGEMFWSFSSSWFPGRWVYRTTALPLNLTRGQTSVTLRIRSMGYLAFYSEGIYFNHYAKLMSSAAPALYTVYTHTGSYFDASAEAQGTAPTTSTPLTTPTASSAISAIESGVNAKTASLLSASASSLTVDNIDFLAQVYNTSWSTYKNSTSVLNKIVAGIDALTTAYAAAPTTYMGSTWGGAFGQVGDAIRLMWTQINTGSTMSTTVAYGGSLGTVSRTTAWSTALRASVDSGRFNRQTITNQSITGGSNIYLANRGLLLVQSSNALYESEALRYLYESCGISPWLGNDLAGGGPTPVRNTTPPYGPNWYMMTNKATSKEDGFVGSDYGEQGGFLYRLGIISGDATLQARALAVYQARDYFRYQAADSNNYLIMRGAEPIGVRNDQDMPGHPAYLGRATADDFLTASQGASVIGSNLLGYFQQGLNQGQIWPIVEAGGYTTSQQPLIPDYWTTIQSQSQTGIVLPQTSGQPDFAWADEENMVVTAKHGSGASEESFYVNMNWREPTYINGIAKIFDLTPATARLVEVQMEDERFKSSGITLVAPYEVEGFSDDQPPDNPQSAYGGVAHLEAIRPDLTAVPPSNQDGGRGTGYTLRYGNWLIGMNADPTQTYAMAMPSDFTSAVDLISGQNLTGQVTLQPKTTAVFYLTTTVDPNPLPGRVQYLGAGAGNAAVVLNWTAGGNAASYNVLRSTTSGGPYNTVASGVTQLGYLDTTVVNGTAYFYVVVPQSSTGIVGGNSPEATATPVAAETAGLPAPWTNADVGSVGVAGSATYSSGTFTVKGSGSDIYGSADSFQYVYAPLAANGSITVKVVSQQNTNANAKTGVMIRQSLAAGDLQVDLVLTPTNGVQMFRRYGANAATYSVASQTGIAAPYWLRLAYTDVNTFTGYISPDGTTWTQLGTTGIGAWAPAGSAYIGMVDTSHANTTLATDVFSNVTLNGVPTDTTAAVPTGLTATPNTTQIALTWNPVPGVTGYNLKRSTASGGPYANIGANVATASFNDGSVTAGTTYYYVVSALNATGESANSAQITTAMGGVAPPWMSADVGSVGVAGTANESGGVFTVQGSGSDIFGTADSFQYVYAPLLGDGSVTLKVVSQQNTNANAKAGVMIRQSLAAGDLEVDLVLTPTNGVQMYRRYGANASTYSVASQTGVAAPYWLRLALTGANTFTSSISPDGTTWTQLGTTGLGGWSLSAGAEIGMADTSHDNTTLSTDVFSNVSLTGVSVDTTTPTGLSANAGTSRVTLTWNAISGATGYNLKRSTSGGGPYTTLGANTSNTSYIDTSASSGATYYYVVSSLDSTAESANSTYVTATAK